MEIYNLSKDVIVFGLQVKEFPKGIGETFERLVKMFPPGDNRSYYGIFHMNESGKMVYYATAEQKQVGEVEKYNCDQFTIEKGKYLVEEVLEWQKKTDTIKDVFNEMMKDTPVDNKKGGVEWYKNEKEMWCMVRTVQQ